MKTICKICQNEKDNIHYSVDELMYQTGDTFEYFQCNDCQCLQIAAIPESLSQHYPSDYYSHQAPSPTRQSFPERAARQLRTACYMNQSRFSSRTILKFLGMPDLPEWMNNRSISLNSKILDVGCGAGHLLHELKHEGYRYLSGVDPYTHSEYQDRQINIFKMEITELHGTFDFIMLNHSFEHLPEPEKVLNKLHSLLASNGILVLRIPTASSYAWRTYKTKWVQLDAPRHLFLHSVDSITRICNANQFSIEEILYDSSEFQFTGSERYLLGLPLRLSLIHI